MLSQGTTQELDLPPTAEHHLVVVDLEVCQAVHLPDLQPVPRNVNDVTGLDVDEVVMTGRVGVEHHPAFGQCQLAEQSFFNQQIQGVVHRGPGNHGARALRAHPDVLSRGVAVGVQHEGRHGDALSGWPDARCLELVACRRLHIFRLGLEM